MKKFIADHEKSVKEHLSDTGASEEFNIYHEKQIHYLQAERLAHLIVLVTIAVCTVITTIVLVFRQELLLFVLLGLFILLLVPYVFHYFTLENTVQRWYRYARQLDKKNAEDTPL